MTTSGARVKSPGWAAFALKQQQKQPFQPEVEQDPFPPISTNPIGSIPPRGNHNRKNDFSGRPFSSTMSSVGFPDLSDGRSTQKQLHTSVRNKTQENKLLTEDSNAMALKKLKEAHSWADDGLIRDIMGAVDNDISKALILLEGMVPTGIFEEGEERQLSVPSRKHADPSALTPVHEHYPEESLSCSKDDCVILEKYSWDNSVQVKLVLGSLKSLPPEPEWDEDEDIYTRHRKDAVKAMRSASQHSRAASNAFLRGDHISAKQHSRKAREEWMAAERLNAEAALEILCTRNDENDVWRLDLHGLHATEATQALREHLQKIESHLSLSRSISPGRSNGLDRRKDVRVRSSSLESFTDRNTENTDQSHASRQRSSSLQVITGVGNHSRGQAALPAAVRSFLNENGYHFDETRPGVISVRPKFRRG